MNQPNRTATRTLQWKQAQQLTVSDLRSLVEWLDHLGVGADQKVGIRADENQKDGYWFNAVVTIEESPA